MQTRPQLEEDSLITKHAHHIARKIMRIPRISNAIKLESRPDAVVNHNAIKREVDNKKDEDYGDYSDETTRKPVHMDPGQQQQYLVACNESLAFYRSQKAHAESIKQKYFTQLAKGIELKALYDLMFRCEEVAMAEEKYITDHINIDKSNFTGWRPPMEKLQIVKLLHTWRETVRCIDQQKGESPSEAILDMRKEVLQAFDEIAPWFEAVQKLTHGLPMEEFEDFYKAYEGPKIEKDEETLESILRTTSTVWPTRKMSTNS